MPRHDNDLHDPTEEKVVPNPFDDKPDTPDYPEKHEPVDWHVPDDRIEWHKPLHSQLQATEHIKQEYHEARLRPIIAERQQREAEVRREETSTRFKPIRLALLTPCSCHLPILQALMMSIPPHHHHC